DQPRTRGLALPRHRRLFEDLHPRRLPRGPLRATHASPAVPVPPVAVRHHPRGRRHLRPGQAPAPPTSHHRGCRGLPHRAERLPRTCRPELLGAFMTATGTTSATTTT